LEEVILNEVGIQALCDHPNIVNYEDTYVHGDEVWVLMEYMDAGCLTDMLDIDIRFDEAHIAFVCKEILESLLYLHHHHRIHRDLKSDNILLNFDGDVKLCDFGYSAGLTKEYFKRKSIVGTPYWMPPELIQGHDYNAKVDIWGLGITAIEMAEGEPPHYDQDPLKATYKILASPPPALNDKSKWSSAFHDFLRSCLQLEVSNRSNAPELLQHPFLAKACTKEDFAEFVDKSLNVSNRPRR